MKMGGLLHNEFARDTKIFVLLYLFIPQIFNLKKTNCNQYV